MSYDAQEISVQSGAPVELYHFTQGVAEWLYTSAATDYADETDYDSNTSSRVYQAIPITRSSIGATEEAARNALTLTVPRNISLAELFRVAVPSEVIHVTVRRVHRGDTSDPIVVWVGRVLGCAFEGASAKISCEPISVAQRRTGLSRLFTVGCPWALYGAGCGLDKAAYATATTVLSASGLVLTVADVESGFNYAGGFVEWENADGITERRAIESHTGTALTLMQQFPGVAASDPVTVYPGCDHTLATCDTQFDNSANYGGFPWMPAKNPYDGNPLA